MIYFITKHYIDVTVILCYFLNPLYAEVCSYFNLFTTMFALILSGLEEIVN